MKIEVCGKDNYNVFVNRIYVQELNFSDKEELIKFIKKFILKIKNKLCLRGFYKIKVFPQQKIGLFLEIIKLDDMDLSDNLDLRVVIMQDEKFFYEVDDYDLISRYNEKRYFDGHFYCVVDDEFDNIIEKSEFGRFIYGKEVINLLYKGLIL